MSAFTIIRLDTTAPVITWGTVDGAVASETMTVLYLIDEPQVIDATLRLGDGRVLAGTVLADRITFDLPEDAPEGIAVLSATLTDDVGNSTVAYLNVNVSGVIPVAPYIPVLPGMPVVDEHRTRSRCVTRSRFAVLVTTRRPSRATIQARFRVARRPMTAAPGTTRGRSGGTVRAHLGSRSTVTPRGQWTFERTPEGPETEAALVALGLP